MKTLNLFEFSHVLN